MFNSNEGLTEEQAAEKERMKKRSEDYVPTGANLRNVWNIPVQGFAGNHYATFPEKLVENCVKGGSSEHGNCKTCGEPWIRDKIRNLVPTHKAAFTNVVDRRDFNSDGNDQGSNRQRDGHMPGWMRQDVTTGWVPTCNCGADVEPAMILDPFGGVGTVGYVANQLGRDAVLVEINNDYAVLARERIQGFMSLFNNVEIL